MGNILVVDDQKIIQRLMRTGLETENHTVHGAINAEEAEQAFINNDIDLVIMDVDLQDEISGYDVCEKLRQHKEPNSFCVIFVSSHAETEDKIRGYEVGGVDYIAKPVDMAVLQAKVATYLENLQRMRQLHDSLAYASSAAMTAMAGMNELGVLVEAFKRIATCSGIDDLSAVVLRSVSDMGLEGCLEVHGLSEVFLKKLDNEVSQLEAAILSNQRGMGRLVQFKSMMQINYPHASLLVKNVPHGDHDLAGRMRDNLALLLDGVNYKLDGLINEERHMQRDRQIAELVFALTGRMEQLDVTQRDNQVAVRMGIENLRQTVMASVIGMFLTDSQEKDIAYVLNEAVEGVLASQQDIGDAQAALTQLVQKLRDVAAPHTSH